MHLRDAEPGTLLRARMNRRASCAELWNNGRTTPDRYIRKGDSAWCERWIDYIGDHCLIVVHLDGTKSGWGEGVQDDMWEIVDAQDADT